MNQDDAELAQLRQTFIEEGKEQLSIAETAILRLEDDPSNRSSIDDLFRVMHSIKGSAGAVEFNTMVAVAHCAEDILQKMREGKLQASRASTQFLLEAFDAVHALMLSAERDGRECLIEIQPFVDRKMALLHDESSANVLALVPDGSKSPDGAAPAAGGITFDKSLKVNQELLDRILNMISELVLVRNQFFALVGQTKGSPLVKSVSLLNQITHQLQDSVMQTRMQPVGSSWGRLPRLVRDASSQLGKKVRLVLQGTETEIDRNLMVTIFDPIVHCLRNAIGHGIEAPPERLAAGKHEVGTVTLSARQEGGFIWIDMIDDGGGINTSAVAKKAVEVGLISEKAVLNLSQEELLLFIFHPGFSTAEKVTELSGRGVGMDVLKRNVESAGGSVSLKSERGKGTKVTLQLPLTLAIVPAIITQVAQAKFAVPQLMVSELIMLNEENSKNLSLYAGKLLLRLGDEVIPVIDMMDFMNLSHAQAKLVSDDVAACGYLMIVQVNAQRVAIKVDAVIDTQEIVIKPAGLLIQRIGLYSGTTVLGDGSVVMILDIPKLIEHLHLGKGEQSSFNSKLTNVNSEADAGEKVRYLVLKNAQGTEQFGVESRQVMRIEPVARAKIERLNHQPVIQSRGAILPLRGDLGTSADLYLVVLQGKGDAFGILSNEIIDFTDVDTSTCAAAAGSFIAFEHVTHIIDADASDFSDRKVAGPDKAAELRDGGEPGESAETVAQAA